MKACDARMLSTLINAVGTDRLGAAIDLALRDSLGFDMSCGYLFRFNHAPILIHNAKLILQGHSSTSIAAALKRYG